MQKDLRLRRSQDFSLVYTNGQSWIDGLLILKALPNDGHVVNRFGFAVGRRIGNAVVRNNIKRKLREAVRHVEVKNGWDMIFIARNRSKSASQYQIKLATLRLIKKANLLGVYNAPEEAKT